VWPWGWVEAQLYSSMTAALEGGEWSVPRPDRTFLPGKTRYPFYRRLVGPQGRSGRAENLVPTGIRSRTVQPGSSVAIATELPGPHELRNAAVNCTEMYRQLQQKFLFFQIPCFTCFSQLGHLQLTRVYTIRASTLAKRRTVKRNETAFVHKMWQWVR